MRKAHDTHEVVTLFKPLGFDTPLYCPSPCHCSVIFSMVFKVWIRKIKFSQRLDLAKT